MEMEIGCSEWAHFGRLRRGVLAEGQPQARGRGHRRAAGHHGDLAMSTFYEQVAAFRRALLLHALASAGGRRYAAARLLGLQPTYLYRLLKQHGIEIRKDHEPSA